MYIHVYYTYMVALTDLDWSMEEGQRGEMGVGVQRESWELGDGEGQMAGQLPGVEVVREDYVYVVG